MNARHSYYMAHSALRRFRSGRQSGILIDWRFGAIFGGLFCPANLAAEMAWHVLGGQGAMLSETGFTAKW